MRLSAFNSKSERLEPIVLESACANVLGREEVNNFLEVDGPYSTSLREQFSERTATAVEYLNSLRMVVSAVGVTDEELRLQLTIHSEPE